jgi:carotenoid cleavage dioxygenase-like enzyme
MPERFFNIPGFFGPVKPIRIEADVFDVEIEGEVPQELNGTFFRCGPNTFYPTREDDNIINGDGVVQKWTIVDGHVDFSCRYVRTERNVLERKARRRLFGTYRNPYTDDPGVADVTDRDNTANTNAWMHAGRLFALREDSHPTQLDPETLETIGTWDFDGKVEAKSVTAHPKLDPVTGEWWSHGFFASGDIANHDMCLQVIDANGCLTRQEWFKGPYPGLTHDFAVTREHIIFPVMPLTADIDRIKTGGDFYAYDPNLPCCFGIMPRAGSVEDMRWFKMPHAFMGHIMNAYTEGDKVIVDCTISRGNGFEFFKDIDGQKTPKEDSIATITRLTFDLSQSSDEFTMHSPFPEAIGEMPRIDPRFSMQKHRYGFMMLSDGLARMDWETGEFTKHQLVGGNSGEPVYVPRSPDAEEGDGFLMGVVTRHGQNRADLVILDAQNLDSEPLAVAKLPFEAPKAFHGNWYPKTFI